MKRKNKKIKLVGIATLALVACGAGAYVYLNRGEKKIPLIDDLLPKEEEVKPVKKVQIIDLDSNTRPFAVMINNNSAVWKYQSGLNDAYIVYELLVEGGITREMAVFKDSNVSKLQSIRSSRHYFLDYALENDAIYVHWGWSPQAQSDISSLKINNINGLTYEGTYFFRDKTVNAAYEHKGYTTSEYINKAIAKLNYRSTTESDSLLKYDVDPVDYSSNESSKGARYVALKYSSSHTTKFYYDETTKEYKKTQNNTEMYDYTSKERMTTKNIIAYQVSYTGISGDNKGRLNMNNIGSGNGYFISEGKAVDITWEKTSRSSKTKYKLKDGSELVVNDGETYIEILPSSGSITINEEIPV